MLVNFQCKGHKNHQFQINVKDWKKDALLTCPTCKCHTRWWKDGHKPDLFPPNYIPGRHE